MDKIKPTEKVGFSSRQYYLLQHYIENELRIFVTTLNNIFLAVLAKCTKKLFILLQVCAFCILQFRLKSVIIYTEVREKPRNLLQLLKEILP